MRARSGCGCTSWCGIFGWTLVSKQFAGRCIVLLVNSVAREQGRVKVEVKVSKVGPTLLGRRLAEQDLLCNGGTVLP